MELQIPFQFQTHQSIYVCLWTHIHADTLKNCCPPVCPGFDLCEVGQEEVVLKTGKLANRRTLHFALQSLLALFGKCTDLLLFIVSFLFLVTFSVIWLYIRKFQTLKPFKWFFFPRCDNFPLLSISFYRLHRTAQASEPGQLIFPWVSSLCPVCVQPAAHGILKPSLLFSLPGQSGIGCHLCL